MTDPLDEALFDAWDEGRTADEVPIVALVRADDDEEPLPALFVPAFGVRRAGLESSHTFD